MANNLASWKKSLEGGMEDWRHGDLKMRYVQRPGNGNLEKPY